MIQPNDSDSNSIPDPKKDKFEALRELGDALDESMREFENQANAYWESLTYDQKLFAFHSVCKRIHEGDIKKQGSYRYVLYDVFGFAPDAYMVGMDCGYMDIHNAIFVDDPNSKAYKQDVENSLKRVNEQYGETLRRLAENEREERNSLGSNGGDVRGNDSAADGSADRGTA
jgi:hypothetical protein